MNKIFKILKYRHIIKSFISLAMNIYFSSILCIAQSPIPNIAERSTTVNEILKQHQANPKADTYYLLAIAAARKNNYNDAYKNIQIGLSINPNHIQLLSLRAALWARTGKLLEALNEFKRLANIDPNNEYIKHSLAELQKYLEPQQQPSLKPLQPQKSLSKGVPSNFNNQNTKNQEQLANKTSSQQVERKILTSGYFIKLSAKKNCCLNLGQINRAVQTYKSKDPKKNVKDTKELVEQGILQAIPNCPENGNYSISNDTVRCSVHGDLVSLEAEINTVYSDFNKAIQAKFARNYASALKSFEHVCSLYPNWAEAHYQRADTLFRLGLDQQALEAVKISLQNDPQNIDAKLLQAHILYKLGNIKEATSILEQVEATEQNSVYGIAVKALLKAIKAGKSYYEVFPPNF